MNTHKDFAERLRSTAPTPQPDPLPDPLPEHDTAVADPRRLAEGHLAQRRLHLIQTISISAILCLALITPATLFPAVDFVGLSAILVGLVSAVAVLALAQHHHIHVASLALVTAGVIGVTIKFVGAGALQGGLDLSEIRLLDFYLIPVALAGLLLSRRFAVSVTAFCSLLSGLELLLLPHTSTLTAYLNNTYPYSDGSLYNLIAVPLALQWFLALLLQVASDIVHRSVLDALRTSALEEANSRIQAQAEELKTQREHLKAGIQEIQNTYAAVQRGNLTTRAQSIYLETMPLTLNFNLLLDRLMSLTYENVFYRGVVQSIEGQEALRSGQSQGQSQSRGQSQDQRPSQTSAPSLAYTPQRRPTPTSAPMRAAPAQMPSNHSGPLRPIRLQTMQEPTSTTPLPSPITPPQPPTSQPSAPQTPAQEVTPETRHTALSA